ncbi:MAG TPA: DUF1629 domain-containing protein [Terriglobales bacterium]|nr:DUF1629 domain-containing protein [Terriglobales bacterium]
MTVTVHKFQVVEGQEWIYPVDESYFQVFFAMDGSTIPDWIPPVMKSDRLERTYSDFPWLGEYAPVLRKPAIEALGPVLRKYGQLLPLRGEEVWLFNATTVLDALDYGQSEIAYYANGDILEIESHVFKRDRIGTTEIFKLPLRSSSVYVTNIFVERVRSAGLRGVSFNPLWTSGTE